MEKPFVVREPHGQSTSTNPLASDPTSARISLSLGEITSSVQGTLVGDDQLLIRGCGTLNSACVGEITFLTSPRFNDELARCSASAVVVPIGYQPKIEISYVQVANVEEAFRSIARAMRPEISRPRIGASSKAFVSASARIGDDVSIYPGAFIGDDVEIGAGSTIYPNVCILERCRIGANVTIYPNATLYEDTVVGSDTTIHAGVVLGCHGFGYNSSAEGHKIRDQIGYVEVGSDVELGANSCVDRGTFGATRIGSGTRFDNMVQVGHNCQVGDHNLLCAQVGVAGSCTTGSFVVMGGQAGIGDHVDIGDRVRLGAQSGVMQNIETGQTMIGTPALPARKTMQVWAVTARLPELRSSLKSLNRKLETIETDITSRNESIDEKLQELREKAA